MSFTTADLGVWPVCKVLDGKFSKGIDCNITIISGL
jgi:hypothetical protein